MVVIQLMMLWVCCCCCCSCAQRRAIRWMLGREVHGGGVLPHPYIKTYVTSGGLPVYLDQVRGGGLSCGVLWGMGGKGLERGWRLGVRRGL